MTRLIIGVALTAMAAGCSSSPSSNPAPSAARAAISVCPESTDSGTGVLAITLPCLGNGPQVHLAGLRGTPTIVSVWASWCDHCPEEARALQSAYAAAAGRLRVVGVDTEDDRGHALAFLRDLGVHYPSLFDTDGRFRLRLKIPGPPATLFVNANGQVVQRIFGPLDVSRLDAYITQYLGVRV